MRGLWGERLIAAGIVLATYLLCFALGLAIVGWLIGGAA